MDAAEVGLDAERLKRIDAHFAGYVADGRLPGWLLTVAQARPAGPRGPVRVA